MRMRATLAVFVGALLVPTGVLWHSSTGTAAGALTADDYAQIEQLYARYYHAIDAGQPDAWADTFTPDGSFNTNTRGREALVAMIERRGQERPMRHLHSNLLITPTAEGADGTVDVVQIDLRTRPMTLATYSRYDDSLVKTAQGWRFKTRQRSSDTTID